MCQYINRKSTGLFRSSRVIFYPIFIFLRSEAYAIVIDFEGLGSNDRDHVDTIGLATFEADASIKVSSYAFITHIVGNGAGKSFPFNVDGNTFITNPGGVGSNETVKENRITFSVPISNLSFYVADVDSELPTIEQLEAEVFNSVGDSLRKITHTAPVDEGDGDVTFIDFTNTDEIKEVLVTLRNIGTNAGLLLSK
jgi:hypothetical protein